MINDVDVITFSDQWWSLSEKNHVRNRCLVAYQRALSVIDSDDLIYFYGPFCEADSPQNVLSCLSVVAGKICMIIANDPSIKAGALCSLSIGLLQRSLRFAIKHNLPIVYLLETAGLNLQSSNDAFIDIGRVFKLMTEHSAKGLPSISLVYGNCTAGGAYFVGLTDYAVFLEHKAKVFLAGPDLVFTAIGERNTAEDLGGCATHTRSGLADDIASDERSGIEKIRHYLALKSLPAFTYHPLNASSKWRDALTQCSADYRYHINTFQLVEALVDTLLVFKPMYGSRMLCATGKIGEHSLGVIANVGSIDVDASHKTCQFIDRCVAQSIPLVFMMNTTGFQVGKKCEEEGIIVAGSRLIQYMANATVPKITLQIGAGYGAGYYAMCGRSFSPDVILSWPNANIAVMSANIVAELMVQIKSRKYTKKGQPVSSQEKKAWYDAFFVQYKESSGVEQCTILGYDDGVIRPEDTKEVLYFYLSLLAHSKRSTSLKQRFGLARV